MEASRAFEKGQPILSDEQYDDLKKQLRRDRSTVVAQVGVLWRLVFLWWCGCLPTLRDTAHPDLGLLLSPLTPVRLMRAGSALQHQEQVDVLGSDGGLPESDAAECARCAAGAQPCQSISLATVSQL
jgi:hypothetical protein